MSPGNSTIPEMMPLVPEDQRMQILINILSELKGAVQKQAVELNSLRTELHQQLELIRRENSSSQIHVQRLEERISKAEEELKFISDAKGAGKIIFGIVSFLGGATVLGIIKWLLDKQ